MNSNTNAMATNKTISDIYSSFKNDALVLRPIFQRNFVWNKSHQKAFIETILKNMPFPEIYLSQIEINPDSLISKNIVVDGQQRISTIIQYIEGDLEILKKDTIKSFFDLNAAEKSDFLNYVITVRQLGNVDEATIREVFRRINLTSYSLNSVEIKHAIYDGEFIGVAKTIAKDEYLNSLPTFNETGLSRMQNLGFVLLVLATYENGGYFSGEKNVETFVKKYNDNYPQKNATETKITETLKIIRGFNLPDDSMWYKKSNLFTLMSELLFTDDLPADLSNKLIEFETQIQINKNTAKANDYSNYHSYTYTGTNGRVARVERAKIFKKYILDMDIKP